MMPALMLRVVFTLFLFLTMVAILAVILPVATLAVVLALIVAVTATAMRSTIVRQFVSI